MKKGKIFQMRMTEELAAIVKEEAEREGVNQSTFVEYCIRHYARESQTLRMWEERAKQKSTDSE